VEIRGCNAEGHCLNAGRVPFHRPELIVPAPREHPPWIQAGSVEDFWQSNKVLLWCGWRQPIGEGREPASGTRSEVAFMAGERGSVQVAIGSFTAT
jgi:hypothetical protein